MDSFAPEASILRQNALSSSFFKDYSVSEKGEMRTQRLLLTKPERQRPAWAIASDIKYFASICPRPPRGAIRFAEFEDAVGAIPHIVSRSCSLSYGKRRWKMKTHVLTGSKAEIAEARFPGLTG